MSIYSLLTLLYLIKITYSQQTTKISINHIQANNLYVLKNKKFISYSLLILFCYFSIISWVSASAYILQKSYHLSTISCGYVLLYCGFIAAVANLINAKLNYQTNLVICFGICCILSAGLSLLLFNLTNTLSLLLLIFSISFLMFGIGFVFPNCFQIAMQTVPNKIGVANSIICSFQAIGGIISSFLIAKLNFNYTLELSILLIIASISMLIIYKTKCLKFGFS
jgi:DHA1 family bicyclomycin/chloramphenicol resistance-like MFS transporter